MSDSGIAAFFGDSLGSITSVTFAPGVTSIDAGAFADCTALAAIAIPEGVTSIGAGAFAGCTSLASVFLPESLTSIGEGAFADCTALEDIVIPAAVASIGGNAFEGCTALASATIPEGVASIGKRAFADCTALTGVALPSSLTALGDGAFAGCTGLKSVTVPQIVCSNTLAVFFGDSLGTINSVTFAPGVTSIGEGVFQGCTALADIEIPASVVSIASGAFVKCFSLKNISVAEGNPFFKSMSGVVLTKDGTVLVAVPGGRANVVVPDGVTSIGTYAFEDCRLLVDMTLPSTLESIGEGAFFGCSSLEAMRFRSDAPAVQTGAFEGVNPACIIYVPENSIGWYVKEDGSWMGLGLEYSDYAVVPKFGESGKLDIAFAAKQAPQGVLHGTHGASVGTVAMKVGKVSKKKGTVKIAATVSMVVKGKVKNFKAKAVAVKPGGAVEATFLFAAPVGDVKFVMDEEGYFSFGNDSYRMRKAEIGGNLPKKMLDFAVAIDSLPTLKNGMVAVEEALPLKAVLTVTSEKKQTISFGKVGSLKIKQVNDGGAVRYEIVGFDDEKKPNISALKARYSAKKGVLKGSFKVYYTDLWNVPAVKKPKLKKITVNFAGFVADEGAGAEGFGEAYMSSPVAGPWRVWVY